MSNNQLTDERVAEFISGMTQYARVYPGADNGNPFPPSEILAAFVELQERRKNDGWIDFNESAPDKLTPVLVMYSGGEMWAAIWSGEYWDDGLDSDEVRNITHWRPMPPMPDQE